MPWLEDLTTQEFRELFQELKLPMVGLLSDDRIAWCNLAFEELTNYTTPEITNTTRMSWGDLAHDHNDTTYEQDMMQKLQSGARISFKMQKRIRIKGGASVPVIQHVLRLPQAKETPFRSAVVLMTPIEAGAEFALKEIQDMRQTMASLLVKISEPPETYLTKWLAWTQKKPLQAYTVTFVVAAYLLGDRIIEILARVREALGNVPFGGGGGGGGGTPGLP